MPIFYWSLAVETNHSKWPAQRPEFLPSEFDLGGFLTADAAFPRLGPRESTLAETVSILRKRKWMIITTVLVTVTLATLISLRTTPKYDAIARIALAKEDNEN